LAKPDSYAAFDSVLAARELTNPWSPEGSYEPDFELLLELVSVPLRENAKQASGRLAGAVDVWTAHELRRCGFDGDEVWPRASQPRVLTRELSTLLSDGPKTLAPALEKAILSRPSVAPVEANVLGRVFTKQADVLIAHWARGPELLVSTKTMLSSYGKNLRNRFEEAYGDAKNLRGRFPLLALGFLFLVRGDIPAGDLTFASDMLRKLHDEGDGYDYAALLVLDWQEGEGDPAPSLVHDAVAEDLRVSRFLAGLVNCVLDRTPVDHHTDVRERRQHAPMSVEEGEYDAGSEETAT
jgi:hypothetical protein